MGDFERVYLVQRLSARLFRRRRTENVNPMR